MRWWPMSRVLVSHRPHDAARAELEPILAAMRRHYPGGQGEDLVIRAYEVAQQTHAGQFRLSGDPFITHPITVALILADYGLDAETIAAALLHDTIEDTDLTLEEVEAEFGPVVARLTDGVTKLDRVGFDISREDAQAETIRKMIVSMAQDVRVLIIKLVDRLHNLRTIHPLPPAKQKVKARESLELYAPLAHRLGFQELKHEMENRSFAVLYPARYQEIEDLIQHRAPEREAVIAQVIGEMKSMLADVGIAAELEGRPKHHYSIYRKMVDSRLPFEDIYDLIGVRVIVDEVKECYAVLGLVHAHWTPVQGRFKDYVAVPKFNLYQSLHTTVIGPDGKPLEAQIRTQEMHARAEFGIAAHWRYKEGRSGSDDLVWIADLRRLQEDYDEPVEFLDNLKLDLYEDMVFVLTPRGDVRALPRGATPVDFAYSIHTEVGHRCAGARINGRLLSLSTELESGDIVEIITAKADDSGPTRDWLAFVRTSRARSKIRQWFSRARREASLQSGKERVSDLIRRERIRFPKEGGGAALNEVALALGCRDTETMYIAVGDGSLSPLTVISRVKRFLAAPTGEDLGMQDAVRRRVDRPAGEGVIVEGLDDVWVRIARCCSPAPGDDLVGFVTVGRGVSVHRADCSNIAHLGDRPHRMIEAYWAPDQVSSFTVWFQVEALDRPNLLRDVTSVISDAGGNIVGASSRTDRDRVAVLRYEVELSDPGQLNRVLAAMRRVESVYEAYRLRGG